MKVSDLKLSDLKNICIHYRASGFCSDCPLHRLCQRNLYDFINSYFLSNDIDKSYLVDNSTIILIRDYDNCDVRLRNTLLRAGFSSFNEVALLSKNDLKKIRNLGNRSLENLIYLLERLFVDYKVKE